MSNPGYEPRGNEKDGYVVIGPGIAPHAWLPPLKTLDDAQALCRALGWAFMAGQAYRSKQLKELLGL